MDGFDAARATGKTNNDGFCINADGTVGKKTNHAGGILGGMSDGSNILLRASIKPTPSISATQHTVNKAGEEMTLTSTGGMTRPSFHARLSLSNPWLQSPF